MCLTLALLAPCIEWVIQDQSVRKHFMIVGVALRQSLRDGIQPSRLRREIQARGIRCAHDPS